MPTGVIHDARGVLFGLILTLASTGCSIGPRVVESNYGRYEESVRKVEEEQLLRHIVLMRYNETGVQLDLANITDQYEVNTGAEARPFFLAPNPSNSNVIFKTFTSILPDVTLSGASRPTISLTPNSDSAETRKLLTPINLETLILFVQMNWPADIVLRLFVQRLNGVPNAVAATAPGSQEAPDFERFLRVVELIRSTQHQELAVNRVEERFVPLSGPIPVEQVTGSAVVEAIKNGLEYRLQDDKKNYQLVRKEQHLVMEVSQGAEKAPELLELQKLLNLEPGRSQYDIAVSTRGRPDPAKFRGPPSTDLHIVPRSTSQTEFFLSNGVEVPEEHVCQGIVGSNERNAITQNMFSVHVAKGLKPPKDAFVAVRYRGYWFYVDDHDEVSKVTFALMFHVVHLDFSREVVRGPALTLPVGR
jgi:hypothetical protein